MVTVGDKDTAPAPVFFCMCLLCLVWVAGNLVRCLLLFDQIVDLVTGPSKARTGAKA
jgi:hypothetical protein